MGKGFQRYIRAVIMYLTRSGRASEALISSYHNLDNEIEIMPKGLYLIETT